MISNLNGETFGPTERGLCYEPICLLDGIPTGKNCPLRWKRFRTHDRWAEMFLPLPTLDETVIISQILQELKPVIVDLFGDDRSLPFNLEGLTIFPGIDDSLRNQARGWVNAWVGQEGFIYTTMNSAL